VDLAKRPAPVTIAGRDVTLVGLDADAHGEDLWRNAGGAEHASLWEWLPEGPFVSRDAFMEAIRDKAGAPDRVFFAVINRLTQSALGYAALMRIEPIHRVIEVGSILYSPALQRTRAGTEAMYLLARHAFEDLGYRRYEWKCNSLNVASKRAALRYGFTFEGLFRQHMIVKGRNRDTAWFSMLDTEWPSRKARFEAWLAESNFDAEGRQLRRLSAC
jgi:RimJ/RimL family protein N-acetyltransferase